MSGRRGLRAVLGLAMALALVSPLQAEQVTTFGTGGGGSGGGTGACTTNTAVLFNSTNTIACDSGLTYLGNGQLTITNSTANTSALALTGGDHTLTTNAPDLTISTIFNNASFAGDAVAVRVTNTASATGARLLNLYGGTGGLTSEFSVSAVGSVFVGNTASFINGVGLASPSLNVGDGALVASTFAGAQINLYDANVNLASINTGGFILGKSLTIGWASTTGAGTGDTFLSRFAAGRLGLSNTTNATEFDAFSTTDSTTSPTNSAYAYLKAGATAGEFDLGSTHTGSSTGLTKFNLLVDGTSKLDYAVTTAATLTAAANLTVSGSNQFNVAAMTQSAAAQSGTVCYNSGTGAITYDATLGCLSSLSSLKTDMAPLHDALAEVMRLRPIQFRFKDGVPTDHSMQVGFSAEETAGVDDRLVGYGPDGALRGVRYAEMTSLLVAAIQELKRSMGDAR